MARELRRLHLLEADPDLGADLSSENFERARAAISAAVMDLSPGSWLPHDGRSAANDDLGMLVLGGALTRDVVIADRACAELIGQGDLIRPSHHLGLGAPVPSHVQWQVRTPTTVARIDRRVLVATARFPEVIAALSLRGVARAQTLAVALAISHMPGIKLRLLALLWHVADRFGRVGEVAVTIELPLTHRLLSRMVGASRPTVSSAMRELEVEARIAKRAGGGLELLGEPPELDRTTWSEAPAPRLPGSGLDLGREGRPPARGNRELSPRLMPPDCGAAWGR